MSAANDKIWDELRKPFPEEVIGKLPRGNVQLDFVGHAAVTDRLNSVAGPENWSWEPLAFGEDGLPRLDEKGNLWIKLTVAGVTRLGYGDGSSSMKELIGDALRNAAMRFGIALDLWTKDELESTLADPSLKNPRASLAPAAASKPAATPMATDYDKSVVTRMYRALSASDEDIRNELKSKYGVDSQHPMTRQTYNQIVEDLK